MIKRFSDNVDLPKKERQQIINIAADHLMIFKNDEPSTTDKILWAECIAEIFPKLRDIEDKSRSYIGTKN